MNYLDEAVTKSLDEFMEYYKVVDTEEIYSNGTEFVPIFRVKQWEEYNNKDKEIERLNGLINTMLEFNLFGEECPLNLGYTERCNEEKAQDVFYEDDYCEKTCNDNYKKCWLKYFKRLQELKKEK